MPVETEARWTAIDRRAVCDDREQYYSGLQRPGSRHCGNGWRRREWSGLQGTEEEAAKICVADEMTRR